MQTSDKSRCNANRRPARVRMATAPGCEWVHTNEGLAQESMSNGPVQVRAGVSKHKQGQANMNRQHKWENTSKGRQTQTGKCEQGPVNVNESRWTRAGEWDRQMMAGQQEQASANKGGGATVAVAATVGPPLAPF